MAASLSHRGIVTVHDFPAEDAAELIVMEYLPGARLGDLVRPDGLPAPKVLRYGEQLAAALAYAHEQGVIHRDVKLSNVIVSPKGRVTLIDFGLAERLGSSGEETVGGSSMWLAPEEQRERRTAAEPARGDLQLRSGALSDAERAASSSGPALPRRSRRRFVCGLPRRSSDTRRRG